MRASLVGIVVLLGTVAGARASDVPEEDDSAPSTHSTPATVHEEQVIHRPGDYSRYRERVREICSLLAEDGRRTFLFDQASQFAVRSQECLDCRPLFALVMNACKEPIKVAPKKKKRVQDEEPSAEEESVVEVMPTPTTPPAQRLPSPELVDRVTELSRAWAHNEEQRDLTWIALKRLLASLRVEDGRTAAEQEYGAVLADFFEAPFLEYLRDKEAQAQARKARERDLERRSRTEGIFQ